MVGELEVRCSRDTHRGGFQSFGEPKVDALAFGCYFIGDNMHVRVSRMALHHAVSRCCLLDGA